MFYTLKEVDNHAFYLPGACRHTVCTLMHLKAASQETGCQLLAPLKRHQLVSFAMHKQCWEGDLGVPPAAQLLGVGLVPGHEAAELRTQQSLQCALQAHADAPENISFEALTAQLCLCFQTDCVPIHGHGTAGVHSEYHFLTTEGLLKTARPS